jgi:hypothetical protein
MALLLAALMISDSSIRRRVTDSSYVPLNMRKSYATEHRTSLSIVGHKLCLKDAGKSVQRRTTGVRRLSGQSFSAFTYILDRNGVKWVPR